MNRKALDHLKFRQIGVITAGNQKCKQAFQLAEIWSRFQSGFTLTLGCWTDLILLKSIKSEDSSGKLEKLDIEIR